MENTLEKRKLFLENHKLSMLESQKKQAISKKYFKFDYLEYTKILLNDKHLNALYEDYLKRVDQYRKDYGNDCILNVPLIEL